MDVRTLCLAVLYQGQASGYEIKKAFQEGAFSHFQDASFGSIYPALGRLSAEGLVECTQMAQEKRPDKKVYKLTQQGQDALITSLLAPPAPDKFTSDFFFVLYFADLMPVPQVINLLEQRISFYKETIERMTKCDPAALPSGRRLCHGLGLTVYKNSLSYLEENKERFIAELREQDASNRSRTEINLKQIETNRHLS
ncbi:PadR family transcriptional regulator [Kiloniella litopenaei]|uniref:PadR family transcriptional regulator n=1 Tax=Kiloniella litopenaei TaxID=1549748 RepID=A0A0M2R3T4_9PROT|nr:PadR family transcriptional regulator [Kiloniella litopenaei]KKJ76542.1 PadR family transcriptional regulator [Kiloniella litopenaei]